MLKRWQNMEKNYKWDIQWRNYKGNTELSPKKSKKRSQKIEKNHKGSLLCFCSNFLNLKKKDSPYDFFENFLPPHFFQKISTTIFKFLPSSLSVDSFLKKLWTIKMDRVTRDKCSWFSWIDLCRMQNFFVKILEK